MCDGDACLCVTEVEIIRSGVHACVRAFFFFSAIFDSFSFLYKPARRLRPTCEKVVPGGLLCGHMTHRRLRPVQDQHLISTKSANRTAVSVFCFFIKYFVFRDFFLSWSQDVWSPPSFFFFFLAFNCRKRSVERDVFVPTCCSARQWRRLRLQHMIL